MIPEIPMIQMIGQQMSVTLEEVKEKASGVEEVKQQVSEVKEEVSQLSQKVNKKDQPAKPTAPAEMDSNPPDTNYSRCMLSS